MTRQGDIITHWQGVAAKLAKLLKCYSMDDNILKATRQMVRANAALVAAAKDSNRELTAQLAERCCNRPKQERLRGLIDANLAAIKLAGRR